MYATLLTCLTALLYREVKLAASSVAMNGALHGAYSARSPGPFDGVDARAGGMRFARNGGKPAAPPPADLSPSHKNLYVLNLPLDATTDQLAALFSGYGTVVHCVILAMLDAQARRRGFIDMTASEEAKSAIESLNGFVWKGYPIEVSYAIVQRSGGPFDHPSNRTAIKRNVPRNRFNTGPRRVPNEPALPTFATFAAGAGTYGYDAAPASALGLHSSYPPRSASGSDIASLASNPCTLFVSGFDPAAILDDEDLRRALQAFGHVTAVSLSRDDMGVSRGFGIVTFAQEFEAYRARDSLDGKIVNGRRITARSLDPAAAAAAATHRPSLPAGLPSAYSSHTPPSHNAYLAPNSIDERMQGGRHSISTGTYGYATPSMQQAHPNALRPDLHRLHSAPYAAAAPPRAPQLGEPFEQRSLPRSRGGETGKVTPEAHLPRSTASNAGYFASTAPALGADWKSRTTFNSHDPNSPASTLSGSSSSSIASELQTPGSMVHTENNFMIHNPEQIWSLANHASLGSPVWPRGPSSLGLLDHDATAASRKGAKQPELAISQLRRDSPPLQPSDIDAARRASLAPVGHEKHYSSPDRTISSKNSASEQVLATFNSLKIGE